MSTYRDSKRDVAIANDHLAKHLPCRFCGASTHFDDLARLGARCQQCYDAYRAELNPPWQPNRPLTHHERQAVVDKVKRGIRRIGSAKPDPRAWACGLRDRELNHAGLLANGARMTAAQCDAWREALRHETSENRTEA